MKHLHSLFASATLAIIVVACSGEKPEKPDVLDPATPVSMVHTYEITSEKPVNLIWNVATVGEEISLNGKSVGRSISPAGQLAPEDQTVNKGTQIYKFESTTTYFISSFQVDWSHSEGKALSYKMTATRAGKVVYTDKLTLPNENQTHTDGIGWSNTYSTGTSDNDTGINLF